MKITNSPLLNASLIASLACPVVAAPASTAPSSSPARGRTFANPLDLPYRFQLEIPSHREAADPSVVFYQGEWWLFASKSGGYWHTKDFADWKFVEPVGLPLENYAPTVEVIGGRLCFSAGGGAIYTTDDAALGQWTRLAALHDAGDTDLFEDENGRVYLYYGVSDKTPIWGEELDPKQGFKTIRGPVPLISSKREEHGWEVRREASASGTPQGDAESPQLSPWIEGSWMTKANGRYYLQYAGPGTELDSYADGVYVGDTPLGPFVYQPSNPVSFRPTGFARGAGHGSTFRDAQGHYWHIATVTIAQRHVFERRLGLFPVKFFRDGQMASNTYLGDYPQYLPGQTSDPFGSNRPNWMLLSLRKPVAASSTLPGFPAGYALDETIKTWWSAATGNPGEWLQIDLGSVAKIQAVQINFADEGSTTLGRLKDDAYRYLVEISSDGQAWRPLIDKRNNQRDAPHDYTVIPQAVRGRYLRLTNGHTPAGARFSVSGLRVFGTASGPRPQRVKQIVAKREPGDERRARISWAPAKNAEFYIVRYGVRPDRLFSDIQVYEGTSLDFSSLNTGVPYYVTVDAINAAGITVGPAPVAVQMQTRQLPLKARPPAVAPVLAARRISLKSVSNSRFVSAEGGGNSSIVADRERVGPWESLGLIDLNGGELVSGDSINLQVANGNFLAADGGGGKPLRADAAIPAAWESFVIVKIAGSGAVGSGAVGSGAVGSGAVGSGAIASGDSVALRSEKGQYVSVVGTSITASSTTVGPDQTFTLSDAN